MARGVDTYITLEVSALRWSGALMRQLASKATHN